MKHTVKWAALSVVTLAVVEGTLTVVTGTQYTGHYQAARKHSLVPLLVAGVTLAHLEGWLPERVDPFVQAVKVVKWVGRG